MLGIEFNFITGAMLGIAHIEGDEEDEYEWAIALGLSVLQVTLFKFKQAE